MGTILREVKKNGLIRFRAEVRREGKRLTRRFTRKTDATNWMREVENKIVRGEKVPILKKHTVSDAIERYKLEILPRKRPRTATVHAAQLTWWSLQLGDKKLVSLTSADLAKAKETLSSQPYFIPNSTEPHRRSPSTVNRYLQIINHVLATACNEWEWIDQPPRARKLKEAPARTRFLKPEEAQSILRALLQVEKPHIRLIALISATLGSRLGETCALRWEDIDYERAEISFIINTKTGRAKTLPVPPRLLIELRKWRDAGTKSEYLFPATRKGYRPFVYDSVRKAFHKTIVKLGLKNVSFHTFRHTVASWATQEGFETFQVQETLGHAHVSTTRRYSHFDTSHLRSMVEAVEGILEFSEIPKSREIH